MLLPIMKSNAQVVFGYKKDTGYVDYELQKIEVTRAYDPISLKGHDSLMKIVLLKDGSHVSIVIDAHTSIEYTITDLSYGKSYTFKVTNVQLHYFKITDVAVATNNYQKTILRLMKKVARPVKVPLIR